MTNGKCFLQDKCLIPAVHVILFHNLEDTVLAQSIVGKQLSPITDRLFSKTYINVRFCTYNFAFKCSLIVVITL